MRARNRQQMRQAVIRKQLARFLVQPAATAQHHAAQKCAILLACRLLNALRQALVPKRKALPPQHSRLLTHKLRPAHASAQLLYAVISLRIKAAGIAQTDKLLQRTAELHAPSLRQAALQAHAQTATIGHWRRCLTAVQNLQPPAPHHSTRKAAAIAHAQRLDIAGNQHLSAHISRQLLLRRRRQRQQAEGQQRKQARQQQQPNFSAPLHLQSTST